MFVGRNYQYCQDVSSYQLYLWMQGNPNWNPSKLFCRYWQTINKVYMEKQTIQNSQRSKKENKTGGLTPLTARLAIKSQ